MKARLVAVLMGTFSILVLAAEEAPPAELLENLEFFRQYDLVKDDQFLTQADRDLPEVEASSDPVSNGGNSDVQ